MMKCPRCGFTQPRDQYCAQCGVDVSSYKPPQQPLFQRLAQSTLLQLGLVAMVIVLVANYLMKKKDHSFTERVNYLKGNLQISSQKPMPASTPVPAPPPPPPPALNDTAALKETASSTLAATKATLPTADTTTTAPATTTLTKSVERTAETANENKNQHTVKLSYYEITNRVRDLLIEESRSTGQFNSYGDYAAGLLNQFQHRLPTLGKEALPLHSETKTVANENIVHWFNGLQSATTENHIGFRNNLQLTEIDPNSFRINFEIIKSWRETAADNATAALVNSSYPLQIEMLKSSASFILGVLTPPANSEGENYIASVPPFTILKSLNFRQQRSQFLILIEIEK